MDQKELLHRYLRRRRDDLLGTIEGLGEYDARRPLTPTGTNLLGLIKHVADVQLGYFGLVFDRPASHPVGEQIVALDAAEASRPEAARDADLWVPATQTRADIVDFFTFSSDHADATIDALELDSPGRVPWWPAERSSVTLHEILVHMVAEAARHAGHADIVRETIDGRIGNGPGDPNVPARSTAGWQAYRDRIEEAALAAGATSAS